LLAAGDLRQNLPREPLLAYNLELPLIEPWLLKNGMNPQPIVPVLVGQDLRSLRSLLCRGFGWTAMPEYLCRQNLDRGELAEIPAPEVSTYLEYFLVWAPAALRQPRVAHARQTLLQQLAGGRVPAGG
jgi:DNA-binding transcriptional LysR family regulator